LDPFRIVTYPVVLFVLSAVILWGAARLGAFLDKGDIEDAQRQDFGIVLGAALTLLSLLIGFSFSMATSRYDQRKGLEEAEANAIGTEYVRAGLLPHADTVKVDALLQAYLKARISFYEPQSDQQLQQNAVDTSALENQLWAAVQGPAKAKPSPLTSLVVSGMNDVLNSQSYTQAAWWNRIPASAWYLMGLIAIGANVLVGFGSHRAKGRFILLLIVPVLASIAFMLIADLDSPRGGLIHVSPQNLKSLAASLPAG
jgi:hypothetical protein